MAGFANVRAMVDAQDTLGQVQYTHFRKVPTQTTTQGIWFDLSMSPGYPRPQYYAAAPAVFSLLARSTDVGMNHGGNVSPLVKYLRKLTLMCNSPTPLPAPLVLLDYLGFYPFIDEGDTAEQLMDNSVSLSRYTDGNGVQIMAVVVGAHSAAAGINFTVNYTNSAGVAGKVTPTCTLTTLSTVTGAIATSEGVTVNGTGPFLPLQAGDSGVRSIESVTMLSADIGLMSLVLVKPLAQTSLVSFMGAREVDYFLDAGGNAPRIYDDAYLNYIICPANTVAGAVFLGDATFVWN